MRRGYLFVVLQNEEGAESSSGGFDMESAVDEISNDLFGTSEDADEQEELADHAPASFFVIGAEDRCVEVLNPRQAHLTHGRTARRIDDLQFLEHVPCSPRLLREQRTLRYQRLLYDNPLFPINARG